MTLPVKDRGYVHVYVYVTRSINTQSAQNLMSNHTDMQDKYCGHYNNMHPIQSQYKGNQKKVEGSGSETIVTKHNVSGSELSGHEILFRGW